MPTTAAAHLNASEPNVTPMLDVLLVLLIIFMSVTIQVHRSLDVQLPDACTRACGGGEAIVLEVLPGPQYRVNRAVVPTADLSRYLVSIYQGRPNKVIQVAGHPGATYQQVVQAIDIARSAGVREVAISPKESSLTR